MRTDTPRTNALVMQLAGLAPEADPVWTLARTLERDLAEASDKLLALDRVERQRDQFAREADELRTRLSEAAGENEAHLHTISTLAAGEASARSYAEQMREALTIISVYQRGRFYDQHMAALAAIKELARAALAKSTDALPVSTNLVVESEAPANEQEPVQKTPESIQVGGDVHSIPMDSGHSGDWRATLREHWLTGIECDHEAKTDVATCFCARWRSEPQPTVIAAVERWIEHVAAQEAVSGLLPTDDIFEAPPSASHSQGGSRYETFGYALGMRVLQSDLYQRLGPLERSECDEMIRHGALANDRDGR